MRRAIVLTLIAGTALSLVSWRMIGGRLSARPTTEPNMEERPFTMRGRALPFNSEKAASTHVAPKASATESKAGLAAAALTNEANEEVPAAPAFERARELKEFAELKKKVITNEQERRERKNLLLDAGLLRSLGESLARPRPFEGEEGSQQNLALDLLFEALKDGDREVAAAVLEDLVKNASVEDSRLSTPAREALAGVKAEVLMNWSAQDPNIEKQMASWLPGPVSQKIWRNVQQVQAQNAAESALEITERQRRTAKTN